MQLRRKLIISLIAIAVLTAVMTVVSTSWRVEADVVVPTRAAEVSVGLDRLGVVSLPFAAQHIAVHWPGERDLAVQVAFSVDGVNFGPPHEVLPDEVGSVRGDGE